MKIKKLALAVGCMVFLCGCTKGTIVESQMAEMEPDTEVYFDIVIDHDQLKEDVDDLYLDSDDYPMSDKIEFEVNEDEGYVNVTIVVKDVTSAEAAASYTMEVIKGINDQVAVQDFTYGTSGEDTYGGLYQDSVINVKIYERSAYDSKGDPMYEADIPKDVYQEIVIE